MKKSRHTGTIIIYQVTPIYPVANKKILTHLHASKPFHLYVYTYIYMYITCTNTGI